VAIDDKCKRLRQLVGKGKLKGYVLWDEIDELLPAGYEGGRELNDILYELDSNGVRVREAPMTGRAGNVSEEEEFLDENNLRELSEQAADSPPVQFYLREVLAIPHLTREKEIELAERINHGGQGAESAERELIEANLWAVVTTAKRFRNHGFGMLDLLQEGNIGLMTAAKKFDYTRGYRFSTYAIWWVRQTILRLIQGKS
jgi:RNA polymerase primary sigma factor